MSSDIWVYQYHFNAAVMRSLSGIKMTIWVQNIGLNVFFLWL